MSNMELIVKLILNKYPVEIGGDRIELIGDKYHFMFWNDAHCGFWKTWKTGDFNDVVEYLKSLVEEEFEAASKCW